MKEQITEMQIQSIVEKARHRIEYHRISLEENQYPNDPHYDATKNHVAHIESAIDLIYKKGIPQTIEYLTSVRETVQSFGKNKPLSEKAKILSEKYPDIPKFLSLMDFLPDQLAKILSDGGFLVMNYQADPHCYDDWESKSSRRKIKKID